VASSTAVSTESEYTSTAFSISLREFACSTAASNNLSDAGVIAFFVFLYKFCKSFFTRSSFVIILEFWTDSAACS